MTDHTKQPTFLVHDYETFGKNPAIDRPAQFAGIRVDSQFNPIVLTTKITPQKALRDGVIEAKFAFRIHQLFNVPKTCILGYNNIQFDDEVSRNLFYRNFYDPYSWSWKQGNSRWDLIDVVRSCYALRPEGIEWPINEEGLPSFRLEHLTYANGIKHSHSHDAMSDVYATLAMAKLVRKVQPKLFNYLYRYRNKKQLRTLINIETMKPLVYVSRIFGASNGNISWIAPLAWHPKNPNTLIICDLSGEIKDLLDLNSDMLRALLYTSNNTIGSKSLMPLKLVHLNRCPVLVPANVLRPSDAVRLGIYRQHCLDNLIWLRKRPEIQVKVVTLFTRIPSYTHPDDVDMQLYNGFFRESDRTAMDVVLATEPENLPELDLQFIDPRLNPLLFRYRARNFPHTLNHDEQLRWLAYRKSKFMQSQLESYVKKLDILYHKGNEKKKKHYS